MRTLRGGGGGEGRGALKSLRQTKGLRVLKNCWARRGAPKI